MNHRLPADSPSPQLVFFNSCAVSKLFTHALFFKRLYVLEDKLSVPAFFIFHQEATPSPRHKEAFHTGLILLGLAWKEFGAGEQ